jgi:hypothetical protein
MPFTPKGKEPDWEKVTQEQYERNKRILNPPNTAILKQPNTTAFQKKTGLLRRPGVGPTKESMAMPQTGGQAYRSDLAYARETDTFGEPSLEQKFPKRVKSAKENRESKFAEDRYIRKMKRVVGDKFSNDTLRKTYRDTQLQAEDAAYRAEIDAMRPTVLGELGGAVGDVANAYDAVDTGFGNAMGALDERLFPPGSLQRQVMQPIANVFDTAVARPAAAIGKAAIGTMAALPTYAARLQEHAAEGMSPLDATLAATTQAVGHVALQGAEGYARGEVVDPATAEFYSYKSPVGPLRERWGLLGLVAGAGLEIVGGAEVSVFNNTSKLLKASRAASKFGSAERKLTTYIRHATEATLAGDGMKAAKYRGKIEELSTALPRDVSSALQIDMAESRLMELSDKYLERQAQQAMYDDMFKKLDKKDVKAANEAKAALAKKEKAEIEAALVAQRANDFPEFKQWFKDTKVADSAMTPEQAALLRREYLAQAHEASKEGVPLSLDTKFGVEREYLPSIVETQAQSVPKVRVARGAREKRQISKQLAAEGGAAGNVLPVHVSRYEKKKFGSGFKEVVIDTSRSVADDIQQTGGAKRWLQTNVTSDFGVLPTEQLRRQARRNAGLNEAVGSRLDVGSVDFARKADGTIDGPILDMFTNTPVIDKTTAIKWIMRPITEFGNPEVLFGNRWYKLDHLAELRGAALRGEKMLIPKGGRAIKNPGLTQLSEGRNMGLQEFNRLWDDVPVELQRAADETVDRFRGLADKILDSSRDTQFMGAAERAAMKEANPWYLPMQRWFMESEHRGNSKAIAAFKKLYGSRMAVSSPFESVIQNYYNAVRHMEDNAVRRAVVKHYAAEEGGLITAAKAHPERKADELTDAQRILFEEGRTADEIKTAENALTHFNKPKNLADNQIAVKELYVDNAGDQRSRWVVYDVHDKALLNWIKQDPKAVEMGTNFATKTLIGTRNLLHKGITVFPGFILRNAARDFTHRLAADPNISWLDIPGLPAVKQFAKDPLALKDILTGAPFYVTMKQMGAGGATVSSLGLGAKEMNRVMSLTRKGNFVTMIPKNYMSVGDAVENMHRLQAAELALKKTGDWETAVDAYRRVMTDFAEGGKVVKSINTYVPFFRARIAGVNNEFNMLFGRGVAGGVNTFMKQAIYLGIPSYLVWKANKDAEWYQNKTSEEKNAFWWVTEHFAIPKPWGLAALPSNIFERILDQAYFDSPETTMDVAAELFKAVNPVDLGGFLPPIGSTIIGLAKNKDLYTGQYIDSPYEVQNKYLPAGARSPRQAWGKFVPDLSPLSPNQIEYIFRKTLGTYAANDLNNIGNWLAGESMSDVSKIPVIGSAVSGFRRKGEAETGHNAYVGYYYNKSGELDGIAGGVKRGVEDDPNFTPDRKNFKQLAIKDIVKGYDTAIAEVGKKRKQAYKRKYQTGNEQVETISQEEAEKIIKYSNLLIKEMTKHYYEDYTMLNKGDEKIVFDLYSKSEHVSKDAVLQRAMDTLDKKIQARQEAQ